MDTSCRTGANAEAGHWGDAHTGDPGTDQCGAAAAATTRKQLGHARRRPQAGLWRLVLTCGLW